jgi:non-heme chloroperoxidase
MKGGYRVSHLEATPGLHGCTRARGPSEKAGILASQAGHPGETHMSTITAKDGTTIYYKEWGTGPVVTLSHG